IIISSQSPARLTCEDRGAIFLWRSHHGPPPTTELGSKVMNRREFLRAGATSSGLVLSGAGDPASAAAFTAPETKRVGLINRRLDDLAPRLHRDGLGGCGQIVGRDGAAGAAGSAGVAWKKSAGYYWRIRLVGRGPVFC